MSNMIYSATKGNKKDTALYQSLYRQGATGNAVFKENNKESIAKVYNRAIDIALDNDIDYLFLIHDDVSLDNLESWTDPDLQTTPLKAKKLFSRYDVVGVAGASQLDVKPPALWHIMGGKGNLHGAVAHGTSDLKQMTSFGPYPHQTVVLDGVFLGISRKVFKEVRFDESCPSKWHYYDLNYTLECHKAGFKVGVENIYITHASPGLDVTKDMTEFEAGQEWFINKWKQK